MSFNSLLESIPEFVIEQNADWQMLIDYVFAQYKQPTYTEWVLIERQFDSCYPVTY